MRLASVATVLVIATSTASADDWSKFDTLAQGAVLATFAADYLQSRKAVRDGVESNPLMYSCVPYAEKKAGCEGPLSPSFYFLALATVHTGAMILLPPKWRHIAQGLTIGVEVAVVQSNYHMGYGFSF